jgi:ABC-type transport system substrate-binding protein
MRADASQWMNSSVRMLVFDTLTQLDDAGRVQPALAMRWDSQSDDRRWQLSLRPDVRFHDGTPLSAATVVQSLTAQECGGCPWRSVHVAGDSVVFESESPAPNLPAILANSRYAIVRKDENGNLVGTGAFKYAVTANGAVTLMAADDSWRARPYVNAVEVRGGRALRDQWMDVGVGRTDVVEVPADQLRHAQQDHMRLLTSQNTELIALVVDEKDPAAQEPRLREALALSLDRASLLNVVFQKQGEITASLLPNWLSGYSSVFKTAPNLARAKELRAQLNRVPELTLSVDGGDPLLQLIADRLALNARDAGIAVRTLPSPGRSTLRLVRVHVEETNPAAAYVDVTGQLGLAERAPADDIVAVFRQEQELLAKRSVIPLLYLPRGVAYSPRVHELAISSDGALRAADFWLEDAK